MESRQRHTRNHPCAVCGGCDADPRGEGRRCYGFTSEGWCQCTRTEHAGTLPLHPNSGTYAHRLEGTCKCGTEHGMALEPVINVPGTGTTRTPRRQTYTPPEGVVDRYHVYVNANGRPVHRTVRYRDPKDFRQERYQGGEWKPGLQNVQRVLYRLPQLLAADPEERVFLVEGERDADRLAALGLIATTNCNGAKGWQRTYVEMLQGRHVVILQDNDEAGERRSKTLLSHLQGCASCEVVVFPNLPRGGDISDWLDAGGSMDHVLTTLGYTSNHALKRGA